MVVFDVARESKTFQASELERGCSFSAACAAAAATVLFVSVVLDGRGGGPLATTIRSVDGCGIRAIFVGDGLRLPCVVWTPLVAAVAVVRLSCVLDLDNCGTILALPSNSGCPSCCIAPRFLFAKRGGDGSAVEEDVDASKSNGCSSPKAIFASMIGSGASETKI